MAASQYKQLSSLLKPPKSSSKSTHNAPQLKMLPSKNVVLPLPKSKASSNVSDSKSFQNKPSEKSPSVAVSRKPQPLPQSEGTHAMYPIKGKSTQSQSRASNFVHSSKKENLGRPFKHKSNFPSSKFAPPLNESPNFYQQRVLQPSNMSKGSKFKPRSEQPQSASLLNSSKPAKSKYLPPSKKSPNVPSEKRSGPVPKVPLSGLTSKGTHVDGLKKSKYGPSSKMTPNLPSDKGSVPVPKVPLSGQTSKETHMNGSRKSKYGPSSKKLPDVPFDKGSGPVSKIPLSRQTSKETHMNGSKKSKFKAKDSKAMPSSKMPKSLSNDWTKWRPVVQSKVPSSEKKSQKCENSEKKIVTKIPKKLLQPPPVCNIKCPGKNSKKRFLVFARVVYSDLLKFHTNKYFEDQEFELNFPMHKAIRDLFLTKEDFFKNDYEIEDTSETNFYQKFLSWGIGLLDDDLSEEKILDFIVKVCCYAISVQSKFPSLERVVTRNATEAIAESCVICISKRPEFGLKIE